MAERPFQRSCKVNIVCSPRSEIARFRGMCHSLRTAAAWKIFGRRLRGSDILSGENKHFFSIPYSGLILGERKNTKLDKAKCAKLWGVLWSLDRGHFMLHDVLMMRWWCTDDAPMMRWCCTDDALMIRWWYADDALMHWWCADDAVLMQWWRTDNVSMMRCWCADDALMMRQWCSDDTLMIE